MMRQFATVFSIFIIPFVSVWTVTQGPAELDKLAPVYEVTHVQSVRTAGSAMTFEGVTWAKHHDCHADGVMYLATTISMDGGNPTEVLFPVERAPGVPYVPRNLTPVGGTTVGPPILLTASPAALAQITSVRLVIPCDRPFVGHTRAYSNPITVRDGG